MCSAERSSPIWGSASNIGRVRKENQDTFIGLPEIGLFLVSDGMGGMQGGKLASEIVVTVFPKMVKARLKRLKAPRSRAIRYWLKYDILKLSRQLRSKSVEDPGLKGMGATLVLALFHGERVHIAHMGDSRAYLLRENKLAQLTNDHSVVGILLRKGEITAEEGKEHPAKGNLTRYLGMEGEVYPDVRTLPLKKNDRFLLCTDGLTGMISDADIESILKDNLDPQEACQSLVNAANNAGGKDNITVVVVDWN